MLQITLSIVLSTLVLMLPGALYFGMSVYSLIIKHLEVDEESRLNTNTRVISAYLADILYGWFEGYYDSFFMKHKLLKIFPLYLVGVVICIICYFHQTDSIVAQADEWLSAIEEMKGEQAK